MIGIDRTTLNRTLQPLTKEGLVSNKRHPDDRRARIVSLAARGRNRLAAAMPHWKSAQREMNKIVGNATILALNAFSNSRHRNCGLKLVVGAPAPP